MRRRLLPVALTLLLASGAHAQQAESSIPPPRDVAYAGTIRLDIDATNLSQRIFKIRQTIPAQAGTLTLLYPMWVPGGHSPRNAIDKIAGLTFKANGTKLEWKASPRSPRNSISSPRPAPARVAW